MTPHLTTPLRLRLLSDPAEIAPARKLVEAFAAGHGLSEQRAQELGLCVNEAIANVIRHAYHDRRDGAIELEVEDAGHAIRVRIRDWGSGRNPCDCIDRPHVPDKPGGVGMICLRELMDMLRFEQQADGMLLVLEKHKTPAPADPPEQEPKT